MKRVKVSAAGARSRPTCSTQHRLGQRIESASGKGSTSWVATAVLRQRGGGSGGGSRGGSTSSASGSGASGIQRQQHHLRQQQQQQRQAGPTCALTWRTAAATRAASPLQHGSERGGGAARRGVACRLKARRRCATGAAARARPLHAARHACVQVPPSSHTANPNPLGCVAVDSGVAPPAQAQNAALLSVAVCRAGGGRFVGAGAGRPAAAAATAAAQPWQQPGEKRCVSVRAFAGAPPARATTNLSRLFRWSPPFSPGPFISAARSSGVRPGVSMTCVFGVWCKGQGEQSRARGRAREPFVSAVRRSGVRPGGAPPEGSREEAVGGSVRAATDAAHRQSPAPNTRQTCSTQQSQTLVKQGWLQHPPWRCRRWSPRGRRQRGRTRTLHSAPTGGAARIVACSIRVSREQHLRPTTALLLSREPDESVSLLKKDSGPPTTPRAPPTRSWTHTHHRPLLPPPSPMRPLLAPRGL